MTRVGSGIEDGLRHAVAAVIPCFNAGHRVRPVVERVLTLVDRLIVVDDGCTDGCTNQLEELGARVLRHDQNEGKGHALIAGICAALGDAETEAVCLLDADGQHNPQEMPALFEALHENAADLVIGSRVFQPATVPWRSRFGNKVTVACTACLLGRRLPDTQCGFRMLSRRFAQAIVDTVPGGRYETEMEIVVKAIREGYSVVPVPIATIYEEGNKSSHFNKLRDSIRIYARLFRVALGPPRDSAVRRGAGRPS